MSTVFSEGIARSTRTAYRRAWEQFRQFWVACLQVHEPISLPLDPTLLSLFIIYLSNQGKAPSTIASITSAIGYVHKLGGLPDPTTSQFVHKTLAILKKQNPSVDARLPITLPILKALILVCDRYFAAPYHRALLKSMMSLAFFGFLRISEIAASPQGHHLMSDTVRFFPDRVDLILRSYKHSRGRPFCLRIQKHKDVTICPYLLLRQYVVLRGPLPGPLYTLNGTSAVPREWFNLSLKRCLQACHLNASAYTSHSFRIGAASHAAGQGFTDAQIRLMGRWNSDAFKKYIRTPSL